MTNHSVGKRGLIQVYEDVLLGCYMYRYEPCFEKI